MSMIAAYRILHIPTGSYYFGSTVHFRSRQRNHLQALRRGEHANKGLQALFDSGGGEYDFRWTVYLFEYIEEARACEQKLIDEHIDDPLMLNRSLDVHSPIKSLLTPEVHEKRIEGIRRALSTSEHAELKSKLALAYWSDPENLVKRIGGGNPFAKPVWINGIKYEAVNEAKRQLDINEKTIRTRARNTDPKWSHYSFTDPSAIT